MKEIIIFCQAPAHIQYTLSIYEKNKDSSVISIFCINVEGMFTFLSTLNLKLKQLIFIPYSRKFLFKRPFSILNEKKRLSCLYEKYFYYCSECDIYFFAINYDWLSFGFLVKLSKKNKIYFVEQLKLPVSHHVLNIRFKKQLQLIIFQYLIGARLLLNTANKELVLYFPYKRYGIIKIIPAKLNDNIYRKYSFEYRPISKRSILLFEQNLNKFIENYDERIIEILNVLKKNGFSIYLKPHPRLGYTNKITGSVSGLLPAYIPGEFINVNSFQIIIGVFTGSLSYFAKKGIVPTYSLINLFKFKNKSSVDFYKDFLIKQSKGKIRFVSFVDELLKDWNY